MPSPDSAQFGFYIIVVAFMSLLGFHFLRWLRQQLSSPNMADDNVKSFSVHIVEGTPPHPSSQRQWQWDNLTPREMEIAQLAAKGKRNSEIAHDLHISVRTVETHLTNIYAKLGVRSRTELARLIHDLVD
jgi:DNA-binding NarL/FixJ family response regulator